MPSRNQAHQPLARLTRPAGGQENNPTNDPQESTPEANNLLTPAPSGPHWQKQPRAKLRRVTIKPTQHESYARPEKPKEGLPCDIAGTVWEVRVGPAVLRHPQGTRCFGHHHEAPTGPSEFCGAKG